MAELGVSERRACRLVQLPRSQARRQVPEDRNGALRKRLCELAQQHPRYGSPALYQLLRREGWLVNRKRVYRLYREEGLGARLKTRKASAGAAPQAASQGLAGREPGDASSG